jgi:hypothetical protein
MAMDSFHSWEKFLNPDSLKSILVQCSLFLAGFEILKSSVVDRLRCFYTHEWRRDEVTGELKDIVSPSYRQKVTSFHPKDEFHACCLWFQNSGALTDDDVRRVSEIRKHRNYIAHEITKIIHSAGLGVDHQRVEDMMSLVRKLDLWWLREVELPTNPDVDHIDVDAIRWEETIGGNSLTLGLLLSVFDGDDSYLRNLYKELTEAWKRANG